MKWVFLLALIVLTPGVAALLRNSPNRQQWAAFFMGALPFVMAGTKLYFALISWGAWPGWPKGLELSVMDFLAVAILISIPGRSMIAGLPAWLIYFIAVLITVPLAVQKTAALFYVWQLLRMMLVVMAGVKLAGVPKAAERLIQGVIVGVMYQAWFAISQFAHGVDQPGGALGARNLLGLMTNFALVPSLALLMVRRGGFWPYLGLFFGLLLDFLTASRATLGLAGAGIGIMLIFSCAQRMTGRKGAILFASIVGAAILVPVAAHSIANRRGAEALESSNEERDAFKRAAWMIIRDHPFGTGPDQYVLVANVGGYSQRAGVVWNAGSRSTAVHDSYLLVLAETGFLGLLTMILLLATPVVTAVSAAFRHRKGEGSEILLGFGVAILVFAIHLWFEWAFVMFVVQYVFAIYYGYIVGIARQMHSSPSFATGGKKRALTGTAPVGPPASAH